jgi:hypothetical protein
MWGKKVLAAEITDNAMTGTAVVPKGFNKPNIFIDVAIGALDLGGAEVHGVLL